MNDRKHISELEFLSFQNNIMSSQDRIKFLEHIGSCDFCAEKLADCLSEEIIVAPRDMKDNILRATKRPEVQLVTKARETSKRVQLLWYSLKVGTATVGALLLLLLVMNFSEPGTMSQVPRNIPISNKSTYSLPEAIRDNMDHISSKMLDFSNKIMKTEVDVND